METIFLLVILIFGLFVVIIGGNYVVKSCSQISALTNINEILIGATIVSFATTLPENVISILASFQGAYNIVVGDGFGTVLVNSCLVLGLSLSFVELKNINKQNINKIIIFAFAVAIISIFASLNLMNIYFGILLIIAFFAYIYYSLKEAKQDILKKNNEKLETKKQKLTKYEKIQIILKLIVGFLLIFAGAQFLINSTENLAIKLNINSQLIALTIISIGTSLPELTTCILSIKRRRINIALGNIIGANIIVLTLLFGLSCIISGTGGITLNANNLFSTIPILSLSTFIVVIPIILKKRTFKWQGYALLSLYILHLISLFIIF